MEENNNPPNNTGVVFGSSGLEPSVLMDVTHVNHNTLSKKKVMIASEVPFTINVNNQEVVTLLCTPQNLDALAIGFLYTSSLIKHYNVIQSISIDTTNWIADVQVEGSPDFSLLQKRIYTSGCGKGVMYANVSESFYKHQLKSGLQVEYQTVIGLARWLQHSSDLYKITGAVHTAALSEVGETPEIVMDDVGRHNAIDKVIGEALRRKIKFSRGILISSGRTSSEILHKVRVSNIAITISRGAPTHQTVMRAQKMGITVIGFARSGSFTVYSHPNRLKTDTGETKKNDPI